MNRGKCIARTRTCLHLIADQRRQKFEYGSGAGHFQIVRISCRQIFHQIKYRARLGKQRTCHNLRIGQVDRREQMIAFAGFMLADRAAPDRLSIVRLFFVPRPLRAEIFFRGFCHGQILPLRAIASASGSCA